MTASVTAMLAAAPQLRELYAGVVCNSAEAVELLESRPPFAPIRLLVLEGSWYDNGALPPPALVAALADARLHPELAGLTLSEVDLRAPGAIDPVANASVARPGLSHLAFHGCMLSPDAAPALARALRDGAVKHLEFVGRNKPFFGFDGALTLRAGLLATRTLTSLTLWGLDEAAAPALSVLLMSTCGHRSLRKLTLNHTRIVDENNGALLGGLVGANAPALTELSVEHMPPGRGWSASAVRSTAPQHPPACAGYPQQPRS